VEDLKKVIWSIWPLSLRREGLINDYEQFTNLSAPLEEIKSPTLVIHGDEDINVDIDHAKESIKRIENSELYVVKEGDHMMHATHSEEIEAQIENFLLKVSKDYSFINTS
jgi:pimeloyl-ACP methyl ester carboxylesterase